MKPSTTPLLDMEASRNPVSEILQESHTSYKERKGGLRKPPTDDVEADV